MVDDFKELMEAGQLPPGHRPHATRWQQIVEAYRYVETGQKIGNVVITVDH